MQQHNLIASYEGRVCFNRKVKGTPSFAGSFQQQRGHRLPKRLMHAKLNDGLVNRRIRRPTRCGGGVFYDDHMAFNGWKDLAADRVM